MGGGHSPITPYYGLSADFVTELYLVDANGSIIHVTNETNDESIKDLFWGIRGGGGSTFGVTVNITFKLHDPPSTIITNDMNQMDRNWHKLDINGKQSDANNVFTQYTGIYGLYGENGFKNVFNILFNFTKYEMDSKAGGYIIFEYENGALWPSLILSLLYPYNANFTKSNLDSLISDETFKKYKLYSNFTNFDTFWEYQKHISDANYYRNYVWNDFVPTSNLSENFTNVLYDAYNSAKEQLSECMFCSFFLVNFCFQKLC